MYRHFVIIALGLSFVVTACNDGGKRRVSLKKGRPVVDAKASERTKAINGALTDSKCLRIDKLITEYMKVPDENLLIYTSDLNIGKFASAGLTNLKFNEETDVKIRASATLAKDSFEPVLESITAGKLQNSSIEALMSVVALDAKCEVASIRGVAETPDFMIIKKSADELWLRNTRNPLITLRYQYNRVAPFTVTLFKPDQPFCGLHGGVRMIKYVIARENAMLNIELDRGFAQAIASVIKAPDELAAQVAEQTPQNLRAPVKLKFETMTAVRQLLNSESFTPAVCPKP